MHAKNNNRLAGGQSSYTLCCLAWRASVLRALATADQRLFSLAISLKSWTPGWHLKPSFMRRGAGPPPLPS